MSKIEDPKDDYETTGHEWDGIREYNKPLPRWWLWTFYATIVWGIGYTIAYPAWPMINSATTGLLGYSTRGEVQADIDRVNAANAPMNAKLEATELTAISADTELAGYAASAGAAVYKTWCAQCHGAGAAGASGYPNLVDDDWLWGGSLDEIYLTVKHGIRNEEDDDARYSAMPAFGRDELLEPDQIDAVVNYVMSLSVGALDASKVTQGAEVFVENCESCHMEDATGDRSQGAPNLADAIWLYGNGDYETIYATVDTSRFGVMPSWGNRLSDAQVRAVSAYVHQLGGGE